MYTVTISPCTCFLPLSNHQKPMYVFVPRTQGSGGGSVQVGDSVDLSTLAHISEGYTAGSIHRSVKRTLTPRRVHRVSKLPLLNSDFLGALAQQQLLLQKDVQVSPPGSTASRLCLVPRAATHTSGTAYLGPGTGGIRYPVDHFTGSLLPPVAGLYTLFGKRSLKRNVLVPRPFVPPTMSLRGSQPARRDQVLKKEEWHGDGVGWAERCSLLSPLARRGRFLAPDFQRDARRLNHEPIDLSVRSRLGRRRTGVPGLHGEDNRA